MELLPLERGSPMLKGFLLEDSKSASSSGFKYFPRRKCEDREPCVPNLIQIDLNSNRRKLQRSRSKAAARKTSAFQSRTSISRRLNRPPSSREACLEGFQIVFVKTRVITVKDIMRWQSFCEFVDEKSPPLDFAPSPQHCTTTTTTTPSSSNHSNCCESDCKSEYLPEECGKNRLRCFSEDSVQMTTVVASGSAVGPKVSNYLVHLHLRRHLMCLLLRAPVPFV